MKLFIIFVILIFLQHCSFDNKTGIWQNKKIFSKKENDLFKDLETLNTKKDSFNSIIPVKNNFKFPIPKPKNNYEWKDIYYDKSNNYNNFKYKNNN